MPERIRYLKQVFLRIHNLISVRVSAWDIRSNISILNINKSKEACRVQFSVHYLRLTMMNSSIKSFSLLAVILLAGCSSPTSRIADCQAQGVSHDTCYLAEQQRQAAILSASEAQAFKNAEAAQHAQAAKKSIYKGFGMTFRMSSKNFAYLNDSLCAIDEDNKDATVYQSGLYNVIVYHHTGKVALMKEGQFVGYLK